MQQTIHIPRMSEIAYKFEEKTKWKKKIFKHLPKACAEKKLYENVNDEM